MPQETKTIRPDQDTLSIGCNQSLSDEDAPFEVIEEEEVTSSFVDCGKSTPSSTESIQKASETSSEARTAPPMEPIAECQALVDHRKLPGLPTTVYENSQMLRASANLPTEVNQPAASLPNVESQAPESYDQSAAKDISPIAVAPVPEATTASPTTDEGKEQVETVTAMVPMGFEERAAIEAQLKGWSDSLQTEFLAPEQQPDPEHMPAMDKHLVDAESMHQPPVCAAARKLLKVLKRITKLDHIPRDEEFGFKIRTQTLSEKWLDAFGDVDLPRREPTINVTESATKSPESFERELIIDLTESADGLPESVENSMLSSPASSATRIPKEAGKRPAKRTHRLSTGSSPSQEIRRGKRQRVTKIELKAHFDQESGVMQKSLRHVCQMITDAHNEIERAKARKEELESWKADLEAWGIKEDRVTRQLEKQS